MIKKTTLAEGRYVEFRAEAFNLPNRTKFASGGPGNNVTAPAAYEVYTAANDPRILQFAVRFVF